VPAVSRIAPKNTIRSAINFIVRPCPIRRHQTHAAPAYYLTVPRFGISIMKGLATGC
jgi:hypothetical protein